MVLISLEEMNETFRRINPFGLDGFPTNSSEVSVFYDRLEEVAQYLDSGRTVDELITLRSIIIPNFEDSKAILNFQHGNEIIYSDSDRDYQFCSHPSTCCIRIAGRNYIFKRFYGNDAKRLYNFGLGEILERQRDFRG